MPESQRTALLIGSPFGGLTGVAPDVESIGARLRARGFRCTPCVGPDATRAEILRQLARLRDEARSGDAIVVYYSGHGGRAHLRDERGQDTVAPHNFLVPIDYAIPVDRVQPAQTADGAATCRGIADFELSLLFFELSERTRNVTVLLDCCHSSTMVRGDKRAHLFGDLGEVSAAAPDERVRQLGGARLYQMPSDMAERWHEYVRRADALPVDSNPHIVRVVATAAGSSAFEAKTGDTSGGYLTRELCAALDETEHAPVGWDALIRRVRERIFAARRSTTQRPEVEGPRSRLPFSMQQDKDVVDRSTLTCRSDRAPFIRMGRIHGLSSTDRIDVLDADRAVVARADIAELFDDSARVVLREPAGSAVDTAMPRRGNVVSVSSYEHRASVWLDPDAPAHPQLRAEIDAQMRLRRIEDPEAADFRIHSGHHSRSHSRSHGHQRELWVESPHIRRVPREAEPGQVISLVDDLDNVARGLVLQQQLAAWEPSLGIDWSVDMFVTAPGQSERRWSEGESEAIPGGTRLHFEVRHADRGSPPFYAHVLNLGVSGRLSSMNPSQPAGVQVRAPEGKGATVVRVPGLRGRIRLNWPPDVPRDRARREEFIVVASLRPLDLRDLMTLPDDIRAQGRDDSTKTRDATIEQDPIAQTHPDHQLGQPLPLAIKRFRFDLQP